MWSSNNELQMSKVLSESQLRGCLYFNTDEAVPAEYAGTPFGTFQSSRVILQVLKPSPRPPSLTFSLGDTLLLEHLSTPESGRR